ncbi:MULTISPECIES: hypothetical protein [Haloferacaceae]|uniref:Uncharacterized protein n=2 Tax=Haloferacaceae TaxID=1644056 RepID=A0ABD6DC50_9EURY|nr:MULTISPECIES: hypothetical protein [Halorubraceae]
MYLKILKSDGSGFLEIFGANDFQAEGEGSIRLWFGTDSAIDGEKRHKDISGYVISAVDEASYNYQGAYETIGDIGVSEETELLVVSSPKYPQISKAAHTLKNEADYIGDFVFVSDQASA